MSIPDRSRGFALEIVRVLREAGYQALWAGGCVRDLLLGHNPSDYDVATDARPEQVIALFPRRTIPVGESFGVVRVRGSRGSGLEVEVATFRSDGAYVDGRRPESVVFSSPREDAERRDFTINGMFLDPVTGEIIDHVGGAADLRDKVLRAIGNPSARFREDKLRLLRAARFAARFGLVIDTETRLALRSMAREIVVVAAERIAQELRRMLEHESRATAMDLLLESGLMTAVLPPVSAMRGLFQGNRVQPEGDLWDHTLLVLKLLPRESSFALALAALLHDVGKPVAQVIRDGRYGFPNHAQAGGKISLALCRRLKLSNLERDRVSWLVEHHLSLREATGLREAQLKRALALPGIHELLALQRADALASTGDASQIDYCENYLKTEPAGPINPPPLLTGHDLVCHGMRPGPHFATILEKVRDAQLERVIDGKRAALGWVERSIAAGELPGNTPEDA
ncbi:MAG: CCA tRNA nucleotidyltransferase [Isosphaeraceae bacterium]